MPRRHCELGIVRRRVVASRRLWLLLMPIGKCSGLARSDYLTRTLWLWLARSGQILFAHSTKTPATQPCGIRLQRRIEPHWRGVFIHLLYRRNPPSRGTWKSALAVLLT